MKEEILEVKKKREFSGLPNSIVEKALEISKGDVKEARTFLRKYFGVFLTNKVIKGKGSGEEILKNHISSKKRDYEKFYSRIFETVEGVKSIVDFGAGVNGFSYNYFKDYLGQGHYLAIEAAGQLARQMNEYFKYRGLENAHALKEDLFNIEKILKFLPQLNNPIVAFLFQVVDALESFEKNFSKKFILEVMEKVDYMVISLPLESLSKGKRFTVSRKWLVDFLEENFKLMDDFEIAGERVLCIQKN